MTEYQKKKRAELKAKNKARHKLERTTKRVDYYPREKARRLELRREKRAQLTERFSTIPNGVWTEAKEAMKKKHRIPTPKVHAMEPLWYISPNMDYTLCGKTDRKLKTHYQLSKITCVTCKDLLAKVGF